MAAPENPPEGDGLFNQLDIVAALEARTYLTGPYPALFPSGTMDDDELSLVYHAATGELTVDPRVGKELTNIHGHFK